MAVEAVGDILPVGYALDNAVFSPELLHLQAAEVLRRRAVDRVQITIRFLIFRYLFIDMFQNLQRKSAVLHQRLAVIQLLQLVKSRDAEAGRCRFQNRLDLVVQLQVTAQESAFAVCQRIGGRAHLSQISISPDVQLSDQIQIIVQHLIEISALLTGLRQNHRQMQGNHADIKSAHEYRTVLVIRRMHAAPLIPGRQKGPAPHGGDHLAVLLVHAGDITLAGQAQPVRIHGLGRTLHTRIEYLFQLFSRPVQVLVIQKNDLREQHRLLAFLLALSVAAHIEHDDGRHLRKSSRANPRRHGDKRIIPAAAGYGIEFIFPALKALLKFFLHICQRFRFGSLFVNPQPHILLDIPFIGFLRIGLQDLVHLRYGKTAVLLAGGAQHDIADHVEGHIQRLGLVIPDIAHLEAAA